MNMATYTVNIPVGPIWNNEDAQTKCPIACAAHLGKWDGQWTTVVPGEMSVCGCVLDVPAHAGTEFTLDVPAGPIWNGDDAKTKAPVVCASYGGTWNGQWNTIIEGSMVVVGCVFRG
jgi:hypothetical protein